MKCDELGLGGGRPSINEIAKTSQVGWHFVEKIEREKFLPKEVPIENVQEPGAETLDDFDSVILMFLFMEEPSRQLSLSSFCEWLEFVTGTCVSKSTISQFFIHAFHHRGSLCCPNLVPFDKFKPDNIKRAFEYLDIIAGITPNQIVFGDEKHLKGKDIQPNHWRSTSHDGNGRFRLFQHLQSDGLL